MDHRSEQDPFDLWVRRGLREAFDAVAAEPVPDSLLRLIEQDHAAGEGQAPDGLPPAAGQDGACSGGTPATARRDGAPLGAPAGGRMIHVVDDDKPVRQALTLLLRSAGFPARAHSDGPALLHALAAPGGGDAGCVLAALRMPDQDGLSLLRSLQERDGGLPVVLMGEDGDLPTVARAMRAGAAGFIEKPLGGEALLAMIRDALEVSAVDAATRAAARIALLPSRERDILDLLVLGKMDGAVDQELGLVPGTVEIHRAQLLARLGVDSLLEAAQLAVQAEFGRGERGRGLQA